MIIENYKDILINILAKMTFPKLRAYGIQRQKERLEEKYISNAQRQNKMQKISRHSRPSTTKNLIHGDVQKAGKTKKEDLPWESIVRAIEGLKLEFNNVGDLNQYLQNIQNKIYSIKEIDVKESLDKLKIEYLLNRYKNLHKFNLMDD